MKLSLLVLFAYALNLRAADWPQFLGPTRNGVYAGNDLADAWPKNGPPLVWQKEVGQGFSGPAVAAGKLPLLCISANESFIRNQAKAMKEAFSMEGVKLVVTESTSFRS